MKKICIVLIMIVFVFVCKNASATTDFYALLDDATDRIISYNSNQSDTNCEDIVPALINFPSLGDRNGARLTYTDAGRFFVNLDNHNIIYELNVDDGTITDSFDIGHPIEGIAAYNGLLYVNYEHHAILEVDFDNRTYRTVFSYTDPPVDIDGIDFDANGYLIGSDLNETGNIYRINLENSEIIVVGNFSGIGAGDITFSASENAFFFFDISNEKLWKLPWENSMPSGDMEYVKAISGIGRPMGITSIPVQIDRCLVAYYPFNGNANDESGNGNNGTVHGATLTKDRFGNDDTAYAFNGLDSYIEIPDSPHNRMQENFTLSMWIFTVTKSEGMRFVGKAGSYNTNNYNITIRSDSIPNIKFGFEDPSDYDYTIGSDNIGDPPYDPRAYADTSFQLNKWSHVAFTKDADDFNFYVNGILVGTTHWLFTEAVGNYNLFLGTGSGAYFGETFFQGLIDEVRIYNCSLSPEEIEALGTLEPNSPPVANAGPDLTIPSYIQKETIIQGDVFDPDGDPLTYRWLLDDVVLDWQPIGHTANVYLNLGTLPTLILGEHTITLETRDDEFTASDEMVLTVTHEPTPSDQIADILAFFNNGIENKTIKVKVPQWLMDTGDRKRIRKFKEERIELMRKLLETAQRLIVGGFEDAACGALEAAYTRIDCQNISPKDWFKPTDDSPELAGMINQLMTDLDCQ
jgi:hypothetical protein